jgi:hypothetical protein
MIYEGYGQHFEYKMRETDGMGLSSLILTFQHLPHDSH